MKKTLEAMSGGIHIFGLVAFAWSLPLFIVLSESEEFFVSYRAGRWGVVAFGVIVGLILPAIFGLMLVAFRRVRGNLYSSILGGCIAFLVALALMPNLKKLPWLPGVLVISLCILFGTVVAYSYFRSANLRSAFTALAALAPGYVLWFIWQSSIVFPAETNDPSYQISGIEESRPPVVLVIFDELSLETLLDESREINGEAFPNFARLAGDSYWFRNSSTVADMTQYAVPAILTGRYARKGFVQRAATHHNYPANAFTLFDAFGYDVVASELPTELCPPEINHLKWIAPSRLSEMRMFISDILVINGHTYLKEDLTAFIPTVDGLVSNFAQHSRPVSHREDAARGKSHDLVVTRHHDFLMNLERGQARLYVLHLQTPHHPYRMLSSGKRYIDTQGPLRENYIEYQEDWPVDSSHAARDMQRYFHQAAFVDGLLGTLLDRMEATGLYDEAVVAITSDHGVSFRPGYGMRLPVRRGEDRFAEFNNAMDIVKTPMFIKLPHQDEAVIIDAPFQSIDILPTLVDIVGGELVAGEFDGRPMLSEDPDELTTQRLFSRNSASYIEHDLDIMDDRYDVLSKFSILDFDNHFALRGEFYEYFARNPLEIPLASSPATFRAALIDAELYEDVDPASNSIPAFVRARVTSGEAPGAGTPVLITINGKFGGIALTFEVRSDTWISAIVDEGLLGAGKNEIALYEIARGEAGEPLCKRITLGN